MDTPNTQKIDEIAESIFTATADSTLLDQWERRKIVEQIANEIGRHWPGTYPESRIAIAERRVDQECKKRRIQ